MGNVSCIGNNCVVDAVDSLSVTASTALDVFYGIVPVVFGVLVVVAGKYLARWIARRITLG